MPRDGMEALGYLLYLISSLMYLFHLLFLGHILHNKSVNISKALKEGIVGTSIFIVGQADM